jgi:hypothetical protein
MVLFQSIRGNAKDPGLKILTAAADCMPNGLTRALYGRAWRIGSSAGKIAGGRHLSSRRWIMPQAVSRGRRALRADLGGITLSCELRNRSVTCAAMT